jgi:hypothetical protein
MLPFASLVNKQKLMLFCTAFLKRSKGRFFLKRKGNALKREASFPFHQVESSFLK